VLLILGINKQPSEPKLTYTHSGNLHDLLPVLHRSDRWIEPVRPVATAAAQQMFQIASWTSLGPGTKRPSKHNLHGRRTQHKANQNTSKTAKNRLAPTQPKDTWIQQLTRGKSHKGLTPVRPVKSTGQTGVTWAARDEQNPRVNSSKSNSRSPNSLHGSEQDFGDSRNTSWALHSQVMAHQNSLNQKESKDFRQEYTEP
jgi:hypothetical protein